MEERGQHMTIETLAAFGANTTEGLHRCMDNESFYLRMVRMLPGDSNFQKLYDAIDAGNMTAAFEAAHALKGSTGNLALPPIYAPVCEITELLRARTEMDYGPLIERIRKGHEALKEICSE